MARTKNRRSTGDLFLFDSKAAKSDKPKKSMKDRQNAKRPNLSPELKREPSKDEDVQDRRICFFCHTQLKPKAKAGNFHRLHYCPECDMHFPWLENPVLNGSVNEMHYDGKAFSVASMLSDPNCDVFNGQGKSVHYVAGKESTGICGGPHQDPDGMLLQRPPEDWEGACFIYELTKEGRSVKYTPKYRWHKNRDQWIPLYKKEKK
jgi:hypothetical protein